jgi:hypothetical protein
VFGNETLVGSFGGKKRTLGESTLVGVWGEKGENKCTENQ